MEPVGTGLQAKAFLPIHEQGRALHLFQFLKTFSEALCGFQCTQVLHIVLYIYP